MITQRNYINSEHFFNNLDDQVNCEFDEVLDDYQNEFPNVGDKYILNKAISSEVKHYFEGIIFLTELLHNKENVSYDVKMTIDNNEYYLNSVERILMHDGEMYSIDLKYRFLIPRLTKNSEINIKRM